MEVSPYRAALYPVATERLCKLGTKQFYTKSVQSCLLFYPPKHYIPLFLHYPKINPFHYFSMINYIIYQCQYEIVLKFAKLNSFYKYGKNLSMGVNKVHINIAV